MLYSLFNGYNHLLNLEKLEKIDSDNMHSIYDEWPEISEKAFSSKVQEIKIKKIEHIIFAGMGGSGAIGDFFQSILSKSKIHLNVVKGYVLPKTADEKTLVVTISVSGNTIEMLSILKSAKKSKCKIFAFSSSGKMKHYCSRNKINHITIPENHSPRASFTIYLYTILKALHESLGISKKDILESIKKLKETNEKISSRNLTNNNSALTLAEQINGIPIIYYPQGLYAAAVRFRNSLQENSKLHVILENVIESSHNGIVAWEKSSNVIPILIQGRDDFIKTKERWKILKEFFDENGIRYLEVESLNGNIISKIVNLIYLLDYVSIYHAVLNKTNPTPVNSIDFIKEHL
jgi:glucose/mannose-6-phosphate isomerase